MANGNEQLHRAVLQVLLEKIADDPYPSVTMMDMAEQLLEEDDVPGYVGILLDKIRADTFPSITMLKRVQTFG